MIKSNINPLLEKIQVKPRVKPKKNRSSETIVNPITKCLFLYDLCDNIHIHYNVKLNNTFNVGVLGSSPRRITKQSGKTEQNTATGSVAVFFLSVQMASECSLRGSAVCKSWTTQIVDIFVHD